jgi:beta-glucanase (GH16 family)
MLCLAVAVAACGGASNDSTSQPPRPAATSPAATETSAQTLAIPSQAGTRWQLSWNSSFNKPGALKKWIYFTGGTGWGNKQLQWYDANNVSIKSGQLVITAAKGGHSNKCWYGSCKYTSARMETLNKFSQKYGLFEARIKFPAGRGFWPAFWMEGTNIYQVGWPKCGEVDVVEPISKNPYVLPAYAHGQKLNHQALLTLPSPLTSAFHTYAVAWSPSGITWYFDGHAFSHLKAYKGWPFNRQFFIILNLAVGGIYGGATTSKTPFPAHMTVSWVHVFRQVKA